MDFNIKTKCLTDFSNALDKICFNRNIETPNHTEITYDNSGGVLIFISNTFMAKLIEGEIQVLKDFELKIL